jgi:hypothetical protein
VRAGLGRGGGRRPAVGAARRPPGQSDQGVVLPAEPPLGRLDRPLCGFPLGDRAGEAGGGPPQREQAHRLPAERPQRIRLPRRQLARDPVDDAQGARAWPSGVTSGAPA